MESASQMAARHLKSLGRVEDRDVKQRELADATSGLDPVARKKFFADYVSAANSIKASKARFVGNVAATLVIALPVAVIIGVIVWSSQSSSVSDSSISSPNESGSQSISAVRPGQEKFISGKIFGCANKADLVKLVTYAAQKDQEAFAKALGAGMLTGECTSFSPGEEVFVSDVDASTLAGVMLVRRKGETSEYWTVTQAVN